MDRIASTAKHIHWVYMAEDDKRAWKDQYMLRLPDGMREELKELAAKNGRSLNAEIVLRLRESIDFDKEEGELAEGPFFIRLHDELFDKIAAAADRMNRTVGAQALDTLEKSYLPPKG